MEQKRTLSEYLECGKIINTHGVRGEVKIESYCDSPEVLRDLSRVYLKENGGYIFSSDHSIPNNVTLENMKRIVEEAKRAGSYS